MPRNNDRGLSLSKIADILQVSTAFPITLGVSWFVGVLSQNVPFVTAYGLFGMIVITTLFFLVFSLIRRLWFPKSKKKGGNDQAEPGIQKFFQSKWIGWGFLIVCIVAGLCQIEVRPRLPLGFPPSEVTHPIASRNEMRKGRITGRSVIISEVPRATDNPVVISDKTFYQCQIIGPA